MSQPSALAIDPAEKKGGKGEKIRGIDDRSSSCVGAVARAERKKGGENA